jgi:energy-coupling factor transporter transmembrane protein EcfT
VLTIFLILLAVFVVLALMLAAATLFLQAYFYNDPVEAIYWRAPAAAAALTLFLSLWIVFDYRSVEKPTDEGRYRPLHELSSFETERYEYLTIVYRDRAKDQYVLQQGDNSYRNKAGKVPLSKPIQQIVAHHKDTDDEKHVFNVEEKDGKIRYVEEGNPSRAMEDPGRIRIFHFGWLFVSLVLNFGFAAVWFVSLWVLLRFQWSHALGLAFVFWLISLFVLPMILTQAENVRKQRLAPPQLPQTALRMENFAPVR